MPRVIPRGDSMRRALGIPAAKKVAKRNKYGAKRTIVDGIPFDSKKEAEDYKRALRLQRAGKIKLIMLQVPFIVSPGIYDEATGQCLAKPEIWRADRVIHWADDKLTVEDTKGKRTRDYLRKKRRVEAIYGFKIVET